MPCLVGCLALSSPRLAVALVWLLGGDYLVRAYDSGWWPLLGFLFLPLTTLTFAYASNSLGGAGEVTPFGWLLVGLSVMADLGLLSGSRKAQQRHANRRS